MNKDIPEHEAKIAMENEDWHPARVKFELELRGWTLAKLSRESGYSPSAAGRAPRVQWPAVEKIIAAALGVPPWRIWPSRYVEPDASFIPRGSIKSEPRL